MVCRVIVLALSFTCPETYDESCPVYCPRPDSCRLLTRLVELDVSSNRLQSFVTHLGRFGLLTRLSLASNNLMVRMPSEARWPTSLPPVAVWGIAGPIHVETLFVGAALYGIVLRHCRSRA